MDVSTAAKQFIGDLKALLPEVRRQLCKEPATSKRALGGRTNEKSHSDQAGNWVYLDFTFLSPKTLARITRINPGTGCTQTLFPALRRI